MEVDKTVLELGLGARIVGHETEFGVAEEHPVEWRLDVLPPDGTQGRIRPGTDVPSAREEMIGSDERAKTQAPRDSTPPGSGHAF
jgi:hypothetical protein